MNVSTIGDVATILGECPVWNQAEGRLYWIDCVGSALNAFSPADGKTRSWTLPEYPGSYAITTRGDIVMAFRRKIARLRLGATDVAVDPIDAPAVDFENERCNDGATDARGRFWFGTMDRKLTRPVGGLYRLADGVVTRMAGDITLSNGIAWSLDGKTLYHCDSVPGRVYAYDFDMETGSVSDRRIFAEMSTGHGRPDGCAVDSEGFLWVVEVGEGRLVRFAPDGTVERRVPVPVSRPTALAFGGPDMRTLFVTSMTYDLTPEQVQAQPSSGRVLALEAPCSGAARPLFVG